MAVPTSSHHMMRAWGRVWGRGRGSSNIEVGKPMERLSTFFEGVEGLINAGTAAVEVGFQMSYSKHEVCG